MPVFDVYIESAGPEKCRELSFFLTFPTKCLVGSKNVVTFALANQQYVDGEVAQLVRAQDS